MTSGRQLNNLTKFYYGFGIFGDDSSIDVRKNFLGTYSALILSGNLKATQYARN